ncbi:MAG: hypothetical protein QY325_07185 [Flavobacteriales bacterium]|jgi:hypothetical protein|nr:MAG: hypothetical protein QY325_07185 [Flavobacteriales bacterium]
MAPAVLTRPLLVFTALLVSAGAVRAIAPPDGDVVLTGWIHVEDHTWQDATVAVEVNGSTRTARVSETGRFTLSLPAGADVVLRFEKPGHLAKEVVVDTRHAGQGPAGRRKRHVKFAVVLELERHMAGFTYHSPVGSIGFDQEGGCLAVTRHRDKVPPTRQQPMVF